MTQLTTTTQAKARVLSAIQDDPSLAESTKRKYSSAVERYAQDGRSLTDSDSLRDYAREASGSERAFLKAAITKLGETIEQEAKAGATPENILQAQALVYRAQALIGAIKTTHSKGTKAHTWLDGVEVKALLDACSERSSGNPEFPIIQQRDRLAIGLLVAGGLRRSEAVHLRFKDVIPQDGRTVLNVKGKGAKDRVVPISDALADAIWEWHTVVGEGRILRSLGRNKTPGDSMTTTALYHLVQKRGELMGKPDLQPHDLRRTYAELGRKAGIPIEQISILLGHANLETTQRYLNVQLELTTTISDFVPF